MIKKIISFYKSGNSPISENKTQEAIKKEYEYKRWSVFISITIGYGFFYVCRLTLSVTKQPMIDEGILTATQLGLMGSVLLFVYGFGKLVNGFLGDRANIKKFIPTGLLISAGVNLLLGFSSTFWLLLVLWGINGWFQSMGSAPCVTALSQWFSNKERGTKYGIWSVSHSIGEGITFAGTALLVSALGWRWGFWGAGIVCMVAAIILYFFLADRPQAYGLPAIAKYKNDYDDSSENKSVGAYQLDVLKEPAVWIIGLSSAFMYSARYAVNNWAVLFLQEHKHYSLVEAGMILSAYPIAGLLGSIASGIISDKYFNAKRSAPTLVFGNSG